MKRVLTALAAAAAFGAAPALADDEVQGITPTEIVVGTHQDLSGPITSWGVPVRNGLQMAIDEANAAGGVHGRKIRLIVEDTGYEPRKAVLATQKLLNRDKVFAILSPLGSPTTLAAMPLVLRKGVLHLFPFTAADRTYEPFHELKFASNIPYREAMKIATRYFVEEKGIEKIGVLYQDDDFGITVRQGVEEQLEEYGLEPVSVTTYKRGATDFSTQIARLRADGAELVALGTIVRETIGAIQAADALGWEVPFVCSQACYTPETADLGGATVEGLHATGQVPVPYPDDENPKVREWLKTYEARFDLKPNVQAFTAYQMGRLFVTALEQTGPDLTQEKVADVLEAMEPWIDPDLGGAPIDFTETDHLGVRAAFLAQVRDGRWQTITEVMSVDEGT